jgi:hypothetical protein
MYPQCASNAGLRQLLRRRKVSCPADGSVIESSGSHVLAARHPVRVDEECGGRAPHHGGHALRPVHERSHDSDQRRQVGKAPHCRWGRVESHGRSRRCPGGRRWLLAGRRRWPCRAHAGQLGMDFLPAGPRPGRQTTAVRRQRPSTRRLARSSAWVRDLRLDWPRRERPRIDAVRPTGMDAAAPWQLAGPSSALERRHQDAHLQVRRVMFTNLRGASTKRRPGRRARARSAPDRAEFAPCRGARAGRLSQESLIDQIT